MIAVKKKKNRVKMLTDRQRRLLSKAQPVRHLTFKIINRFCKDARRGVPGSVITDFLGIPNSTFHKWISDGQRFFDGGCSDPQMALAGIFVKRYRKAAAIFLKSRQRVLMKEDNKLFYREIVILERRDKKNWGKSEPTASESDVLQPDERYI